MSHAQWVHLAHEKTAAHLEGHIDRRGKGLGDFLSVEEVGRTVVRHDCRARYEVEREEDTRHQKGSRMSRAQSRRA